MELKELLGEELYNQVMEKVGEKELIVNDGSYIKNDDGAYIPREKFNELNEDVKQLKQQVKERDNQLEELRKQAKDSEELQEQIKELQEKNEETQQEYEDRIQQQRFDHAVEQALMKQEAKNVKAAKALLDTDKISLDDNGNLIGLEEQVKTLKESDPYLFGPNLKGRDPHKTQNPPPEPDNPWKKETWNLTKQGEIYREEPEKAEKLMRQAGVE